jgi:hypothetical protein
MNQDNKDSTSYSFKNDAMKEYYDWRDRRGKVLGQWNEGDRQSRNRKIKKLALVLLFLYLIYAAW